MIKLTNRIEENMHIPIESKDNLFVNKKPPTNCFYIDNKYICEVLENDLLLISN